MFPTCLPFSRSVSVRNLQPRCPSWIPAVVFRYIGVLFTQISQQASQSVKMWTHDVSQCHWKASDSHASGFVVYVLQLTIMYQSHQVLDSLCSLSPLAPWLPQLAQTVNEVHKTTRLVSAIVDIQQCTPSKKKRRSGSLTATCPSLYTKSSQMLSHFRSLGKKNQPKQTFNDCSTKAFFHISFFT